MLGSLFNKIARLQERFLERLFVEHIWMTFLVRCKIRENLRQYLIQISWFLARFMNYLNLEKIKDRYLETSLFSLKQVKFKTGRVQFLIKRCPSPFTWNISVTLKFPVAATRTMSGQKEKIWPTVAFFKQKSLH